MRRRPFLLGAAAFAATPSTAPRSFGRGDWAALLAAHANQPLIAHFWGLTCGPCLAELPAWGALETGPARLVLIAADPVPQPADQVIATLTRAGLAAAETWAFDGRFAERLYFEIDPTWQGELPRTTLRAANGDQDTWLGAADFTHVRAWLARQPS
jgi:thiol-disulfide isomerase/thioredoxin